MVADVQVGAFLSGGLDSSAIVAFAREHTPDKLACFTIDYRGGDDGEMIDDLPYARRAAQHLGVDLHEIAVDSRMATEFEALVYTLDEPQADPAALNSLKIASLARSHGIKVLLSGSGGDDVFTGYRRHRAAALDARIERSSSVRSFDARQRGCAHSGPVVDRAALAQIAVADGRGQRCAAAQPISNGCGWRMPPR